MERGGPKDHQVIHQVIPHPPSSLSESQFGNHGTWNLSISLFLLLSLSDPNMTPCSPQLTRLLRVQELQIHVLINGFQGALVLHTCGVQGTGRAERTTEKTSHV